MSCNPSKDINKKIFNLILYTSFFNETKQKKRNLLSFFLNPEKWRKNLRHL